MARQLGDDDKGIVILTIDFAMSSQLNILENPGFSKVITFLIIMHCRDPDNRVPALDGKVQRVRWNPSHVIDDDMHAIDRLCKPEMVVETELAFIVRITVEDDPD